MGAEPYIKHNELWLCISGPEFLKIPAHPNIKVIKQTDSLEVREFYTLSELEDDILHDCYVSPLIGFIHSKGVTADPNNKAIEDWRRMMAYWTLERWQDAVEILDGDEQWDAYGADLRDYPSLHFSGTCWIARPEYLLTLPRISEISGPNWARYQNPSRILSQRHSAEFWIGMNSKAKLYECYSCGIDQFERHLHEHSRELYATH